MRGHWNVPAAQGRDFMSRFGQKARISGAQTPFSQVQLYPIPSR